MTNAKRKLKLVTREDGDVARTVDKAWFEDRIRAKEMTHWQVAAAIHMHPSALSRRLNGDYDVSIEEAEALASVLGEPLDNVIEALGGNPTVGALRRVPLKGFVGAGERVILRAPNIGVKVLPAPASLPDGSVALLYQTAGTALDMYDGWTVFYTPQRDVNPDAKGRLCVVQIAPDGDFYLRFVRPGYRRGVWNLISQCSEKDIDGVALESASPVVWIKTGL